MASTFVELKANIAQIIQDTGMAKYLTAELTQYMLMGLKIMSVYVPHVVPISYNLETRTGTATSTSSGNLVDATEAQFLSTDVGKVVYNIDDWTWALIKTYSSTSQVALSKDIFTSGEDYEIYNANCRSSKELYIGDVIDYLDIRRVEFPIGSPRNFRIEEDILTLLYDGVLDDTKDVDAVDEVLIFFDKRQKVSQLTTLVGALTAAGAAAAATSIPIDGLLPATGVVEQDQELTIANTRGIYTVAAAVTLAAGAGTLSIYPCLENAVVNDQVITLKQSTLNTMLENIFCELVAGLAMVYKSPSELNSIAIGGDMYTTSLARLGTNLYAGHALIQLQRMAIKKIKTKYSRY